MLNEFIKVGLKNQQRSPKEEGPGAAVLGEGVGMTQGTGIIEGEVGVEVEVEVGLTVTVAEIENTVVEVGA
jgi:hypothetical protein